MERNHPFILLPKKKRIPFFKYFNAFFVVMLCIGLFYSTAALFFPEKVPSIQALIAQQSGDQKPQQGVLGFLIAQAGPTVPPAATATPTIGPTATPAPPTATPTPTPIPTFTLSGTVFNDVDLDTTKDASEAPLANVIITFSGPTNTSIVTNASGTYSVTLLKGTYTVTMTVPSGYKATSTNPRSVNLTANTTANFGLAQLFTLSGNVYLDTNISLVKDLPEVGYEGATVSVSGPTPSSTTTDASGNFTMPSLVQGTYIITVTVPGGYKATTANPVSINLNANLSTTFGLAQVYTVTGNVFLDNNRNAIDDTGDGNYTGATITFTGIKTITARTDANGAYSALLFAGSYTASTPLPANYQSSTPLSQTVTVGPNGTVNFGLIPTFTISGTVYEDKNEDGKKGSGDSIEKDITINLSGAATASTVTDDDGTFTFPNLYAGTYTISYTLPAKKKNTTTTTTNVTFTSPTTAGTGGTTGGSTGGTTPPPVVKTVEFGMVTLYNVIGKVFIDLNKNGVIDPSEPFFANAKVTLTKATPTSMVTDASGNYGFLDRGSGDYTIALDTPTGYRSTTANSLNFSLATDRIMNFGIVESTTTKVGGQCSANGVDIMIVFDDSGSMQDFSPPHGTTKFIAAQRAASSFIDIVSSHVKNAEYGLVIFSGSDNYPNNSLTRVSQPLTKSAASIKTAIANVPQNGGGTCVECGITLANSELSKSIRNAQKVVIVMTDGATNQTIQSNGGTVAEDIGENATMVAAINGVNGQNVIYQVVGIGDGAAEFDPVFMQQIADTNGGRFYATSTQETLEAIYQSIAEDIGTGVVNGMVFDDKNSSKTYDANDAPLGNWTLNATASGMPQPIQTVSDVNGKFSFTGLCSKDFIFTEELQAGWYQTTDNKSYFIPVESGNTYNNNDFGNAIGFSISGNIFNDFDRNALFAPPDVLFTEEMTLLFSGPTQKLVTTTDGKYTSGTMPPGTYNVSLISPLTTGYRMSYPLNGPPPSFQVNVGVNCNVNGAVGAVCN